MKSLRPAMILTMGPLLFGVALAVSFWVALPGSRGLTDVGWSLLVGVAGGLVIFGPIAAALAIRQRRPDWWARYAFRIDWYTSLAMMFSLGYFVAQIRHGVLDNWGSVAVVVVGFGAVIKIALGAAEPEKKQ